MFNVSTMLAVVLMTGYSAALVLGQTKIPTAEDVSVKAEVPTPKETIPTEQLKTLVSRGASGAYSKDRVISPPKVPLSFHPQKT